MARLFPKVPKTKRPNLPQVGSSFGSSAIFNFLRSVAFCPLLTEGLALSGVKQKASETVSDPPEGLDWHPLESRPHDSLQKVKGWVVKLIRGKKRGTCLMGGDKIPQTSCKFHHIMCLYFYDTLNFHLSQDNNCKNI